MNATKTELTEEQYLEALNDIFGTVEICGQTFDAGYALKELDPTAFRCGMADYEDTLPEEWNCDECGDKFDDQDDAEDCCTDRAEK